ncbi:MAG: galactose-1-phosphate uridylyltransferase [bacterium]
MPEIRQNIATKEWVIIATERAKRPEEFSSKGHSRTEDRPELIEKCPFCPGNETKTPPETFRISRNSQWRVRVIPNKFAALQQEGERKRTIKGVERSMSGVGIHEVIIETPLHNKTTALLSTQEVTDIINAYRNRHETISSDPRIELVIIFKNHGESAGTSLEHPHSQLIATPIVPSQIRHRLEDALVFSDDYGQCVYCQMLRDELNEKIRLIEENDYFAAFILYAAASPFHIWIMPKRHMACFSLITDEETSALAATLGSVLKKLYYGLGDPDFNYVIRSVPIGLKTAPYFHWYLSIVPRLSKAAGFELGSGMFINTSLPEQSAEFLRGINC